MRRRADDSPETMNTERPVAAHTMRTETCTFFSDGLRLSGAFFLPEGDSGEGRRPLVVACSGFTGLMNIHPARFARFLTGDGGAGGSGGAGHRCFSFDYRGFADSEGERGCVTLEEQTQDIRAALSFVQSDPRVDPDRIILLGWGMGAGLVMEASRGRRGVIGIIGANGFYNGDRVQRAHRDEVEYAAFVDRVHEAASWRARTGEDLRADPFDLYPLDPQSRAYVDSTLKKFERYDAEPYSYELAESLLRWRPEAHAPHMTIPLLVAHGDQNRLHPTSEATSLFELYGGEKQLFWIEGAGHTEFMHDDDPKFRALAGRINEFVDRVTAGG
ncbi:MAG: alpha/beta hydrolase [Phycisphaeraceae bacterium]|nr:MAG: alpha/beta hydrolase [Phycisphaeraceae bacterium]